MSESTGINLISRKFRISNPNSLMDWIGSFGTEDIGVDIGTSNTVLFVKHKGLVFPEASVIAKRIFCLWNKSRGNGRENSISGQGYPANEAECNY